MVDKNGKGTGPSAPPAKRSGEHPAVQSFRKKLDSIETTTVPQLQQMNSEIDALVEATIAPRASDDEDERDTPIIPMTVDLERCCATSSDGKTVCTFTKTHAPPCSWARVRDTKKERGS